MAASDSGHTLPPKSTWLKREAGSGAVRRFDE